MINSLQAYRFFFVLLILFSHFHWQGTPLSLIGGEYGVSFFFILSGFVLSVSQGQKVKEGTFNLRQFVTKQLVKFYPLHILILLIYVILDIRDQLGENIIKALLNVSMLQSWVLDNTYNFAYNGVTWFLSDIMFFYLLFPWLYRSIMLSGRKQLAIGCTLVGILLMTIVAATPEVYVNTILYTFPPVRSINFAIGILICRFYKSDFTQSVISRVNNNDRHLTIALELSAIAIIVTTFVLYRFCPPRIGCMVFFLLPVSALIYISAITDNSKGLLTRLLHNRQVQTLGTITMEIFMIHMLIIRIFIILRNNHIFTCGLTASVIILLVTTIAAAYTIKKFYADKIYSIYKNRIVYHEQNN